MSYNGVTKINVILIIEMVVVKMLTTFLNLVNMRSQYERGYNAGLPGLLSLVLFGAIIYFFKPIYRFLDYVGIISLLEDAGIIHPYDGGVTIWRLFVASVIIVLIITLVLVILIALANLAPFLGYLLIPLILVLAGPVFLAHAILNKVSRPSTIKQCLLRGFKEGKAKEVSLDDVDKELDRFPSYDDYFFYIAVTRSQDVYVLVSRPKGMKLFGEDQLWGIKVKYPKEISIVKPVPLFDESYPRPINKSDILYVIENRTEEFLEFFKFLRNEKYVFSSYVPETKEEYEKRKLSLLEDLTWAVKNQSGILPELNTPIQPIKDELNRLTEIERREAPTIFKEGWVYERKPRTAGKE